MRISGLAAPLAGDSQTSISLQDLHAAVGKDRFVWTNVRCKTTAQQLLWKYLREAYHAKSEVFLRELEEAEPQHAGNLELNPELEIPEYARHEIHIQPGGYIGDPLGGYIYNHAVNVFTFSRMSEDAFHLELANLVPTPEDGRIEHILDLGAGIGQLPMAMKERFKDARVCGLDAAAPMLRYAHMRAVTANIDVQFVQRLAERTGFPDQSFDIITAYILFHEGPTTAARQIVAEAARLLRPGGVFFPVDFATGHTVAPGVRFNQWWDHVHNNEVWTEEYRSQDFGALLEAAGLVVTPASRPGNSTLWNGIRATKPQ